MMSVIMMLSFTPANDSIGLLLGFLVKRFSVNIYNADFMQKSYKQILLYISDKCLITMVLSNTIL